MARRRLRVQVGGDDPAVRIDALRLARARAIARLARRLPPDAIIERYHNFGGEAMRPRVALGAVAVLEVNAPVIDIPARQRRCWIARCSCSRCGVGAITSAA